MMNKILQFFKFEHLKDEKMREASSKFAELALWMDANLPSNPETTVAFRKLLEGKDAAVRSLIYKEPEH